MFTENPVPLKEMAAKFWKDNEHGQRMAEDLKANIGRRGPPQSLVATKCASALNISHTLPVVLWLVLGLFAAVTLCGTDHASVARQC